MKKTIIILVAMVVLLSGAVMAEDYSDMKVAVILPSPRDDGGWSTTAYNALMELEENYGVDVAYSESVSNADAPEFILGYANQGYDWIISHSFTYGEIVKAIAPDYPEIYFTVNSSDISQEPNVSSFNYTELQMGFLQGIVAGLITENNKVAAIGGKEIPPIIDALDGFERGVYYVNPDAEIITTITGNAEDVSQAQETALSMIEDGVDVLMADADQASIGVIYAAEEEGVYAIGANSDQYEIAPGTVVTSGLKNYNIAMDHIFQEIIKDNFEAKFYSLGIAEDAVGLAPFRDFEDKLPEEVFEEIDRIIDDILSGDIILNDLPTPE